MKYHSIWFPDTPHEPLNVPEGTCLATVLTAENSPVLFGCRTGICGTCLIEVLATDGTLCPPQQLETETLMLYGPDDCSARLACQIRLTASISLKKIHSL